MTARCSGDAGIIGTTCTKDAEAAEAGDDESDDYSAEVKRV